MANLSYQHNKKTGAVYVYRWSVWFYGTDGYAVYPKEIPESDLLQGKRGTVAIERNNARQRHWLARSKRKSLVVQNPYGWLISQWLYSQDFM